MRRKLTTRVSNPGQRFIGCGDLHATKSTPRYRIDPYWETWQGKMRWIIKYANEVGARLLIAGDIFDTSRVSPDVINIVLAIFLEAYDVPYVVPGQHDLKYHTDLDKCPLYTLALAGAVKIIGKFEQFTGAGFGDPIPTDANKFLITHTTITEGDPPFFLQDAISAEKFMKQNKQFEIIISGDYHVPFSVKKGKQLLINTGTLIRNKKNMHGYHPCIWDIMTGGSNPTTVERIEVPHERFLDVFDIEGIAYDKDHGIVIDTDKLKELIDSGVESNDLESIVWTIFKGLENDGVAISKKLTEEVLLECL